MAVVFDYIGKVVLLSESDIPAETHDEWTTTLTNEKSRIGTNLLNKIPDEPTFQNLIADPSSYAWANFVNPDWPNADIVKVKQKVKLYRAYGSWDTGVRAAYVDGYFVERVLAKKDKWLLARYPISIVGIRHDPNIKWRAGTKAVKFFVGDYRITKYMDPALDTYSGDPTNVVKDAYGKFFQPLVLGKLVYGYTLAKYADEIGMGSTRDSVISAVNADLDEILSCALNSAKADPAKSYLHLSFDGTDFFVRAHAEL